MPSKKVSVSGIFLYLLFFISCKEHDKVFESLSSSHTNISFVNRLPEREGFNILYYLYYYEGGGVGIGDINNDGLPDIYFTANTPGNNKLYLNKGNFVFEDITDKAGVPGTSEWCSGVTMVDINADGWLDIYVMAVSEKLNLKGHNELFINNRDGTFSEQSSLYGLDLSCYSSQASFFDYDHDGDLDCYILNQSDRPFENITDTSNRRKFDRHSGDRFLRNDLNLPANKFTDISSAVGIFQSNLGYGLGLAVADLNNDGWDDIYIGNDFHENDYYYVNNGRSSAIDTGVVTFSEQGSSHFNHYSRFSMGNDIADFNNDGQPDIITTDMLPSDEKILKTYGSDENPEIYNFKIKKNGYQDQYSKNCLHLNNGNGSSFSEIALLSGVSATDWSWCPLLTDFDNDGNKDLLVTSGVGKRTTDMDYVRFVSNAYIQKQLNPAADLDEAALDKMPDGKSHPYFFKGDGKYFFNDVSDLWGTGQMHGYYNGASYGDLNNDGALDVVINSLDGPAIILKNNSAGKNFLSISFKGDGLNTMGIGSKAYVFSGNKMQYHQLIPTRGFQSSSDPRLHFGLDSASVIDSILIVWPDQKFQVLKNIRINQQLIIQQKNAGGHFIYGEYFKPVQAFFAEVTDSIPVKWTHMENDFSDYNVQYLIPHSQASRGPKIATADVNGDRLEDFFVCGASGQPGALMIQQKNGGFLPADTSLFSKDAPCEDVDAIFFDANGDGYPDLYVVSGGNEFFGENIYLADRLYLNNGAGNFTKAAASLPKLLQNKSCISVADIDKDGDEDIFVGTLADSKAFGLPQTSHLLINDGKGNFSIAGQGTISLSDIGLLTASAFTDVNNDGWKDLIVTGEWMPVIVFINQNGKFIKTGIPNSTGLWQCIFTDDVNGDGNIDFFAGNWGFNNKFWSGKEGPLNLYVSDFDNNGNVEQLISYRKNGEEYPFLCKDELERPLPLLKKHYLSYSEYAGLPMKEAFYGWIDNVKPYSAERLGSAIFFGDGKGNFNITDLPPQLQLTPLFSFQKIVSSSGSDKMYIAGGNFFDVTPYEGKYDAQSLGLFQIKNDKDAVMMPQLNLAGISGQVRDLKWLHTATYGNVLMAARNDEAIVLLKEKLPE